MIFEEYNQIFVFLFGVIVLIILGRIFITPIKFILKLALNSALGAAILLAINYFGSYIGLSVGVNIVTVLISGILGVPGVILILLLRWLNLS